MVPPAPVVLLAQAASPASVAPPAHGPVVQQPQILPNQLFTEAKDLRDFRKYDPQTFDGSLEDPTKADLWLSFVETIFNYKNCPEKHKVECAVFLLRDRGIIWWRSSMRMLGGTLSQITLD